MINFKCVILDKINKTKYGSRVTHPKQSPKREAELSERSRESVKLAKIQAIVQNVANVNVVLELIAINAFHV